MKKKVIEYNSSMSKQADFIVDEAFTKAMADELGKREFTIPCYSVRIRGK